MAIHTLAAAVNKCYHGMGSKIGMPTINETYKKSLTKSAYDRIVRTENFGKHANTDADGVANVLPEYSGILIIDAIMCHERMFGDRTPLMTCFFARFAFENPPLIRHINADRRKQGRDDIVGYEGVERDRVKFLERELPALLASISAGEGGPFHGAPPADL